MNCKGTLLVKCYAFTEYSKLISTDVRIFHSGKCLLFLNWPPWNTGSNLNISKWKQHTLLWDIILVQSNERKTYNNRERWLWHCDTRHWTLSQNWSRSSFFVLNFILDGGQPEWHGAARWRHHHVLGVKLKREPA